MWLVGLDPGGLKQFGWCIVEAEARLPVAIRASGCVDSAGQAVRAVGDALGQRPLAGVGIDSPLFWVDSGDRAADQLIRRGMSAAGAQHVNGTVQRVNSLRGACIAQGVVAATLFRRAHPSVRITEAHPKALLWLLGVASHDRAVIGVQLPDLAEFVQCEIKGLSEHERDAALAAVGAWAMVSAAVGWRNLVLMDQNAFLPAGPVEYWMPLGGIAEQGDAC